MTPGSRSGPVVVDGVLSDEKLAELLALRTEYPELDYKATIELESTEGRVELAKDIGAMEVRGGYIIGGVDGHGTPTGPLDGVDRRPFDEANLVPSLLRWLPEPSSSGREWQSATVTSSSRSTSAATLRAVPFFVRTASTSRTNERLSPSALAMSSGATERAA
jgi:hypothetical protein